MKPIVHHLLQNSLWKFEKGQMSYSLLIGKLYFWDLDYK